MACSGGEKLGIRADPVQRRSLTETIEATGRLQARGRTEVAPRVAGRLVDVTVSPGERVQAGAVLGRVVAEGLTYDQASADARLRSAQARRAQSQVQLDQARGTQRRTEALYADGQTSAGERDEARAAVARARSALRIAEAELSVAEAERDRARDAAAAAELRAPAAGTVLTVPRDRGLRVSPGGAAPFVLSEPLDHLTLEASVGEADVGRLKAGGAATFDVPAFPERRFSAVVERVGVSGRLQDGVVRYPVWMKVPNPDRDLLPGMSAAVRFELRRVEDCLVVREAALRFTPPDAEEASPRSRVFVLEGEQLRAISVEVGLSDGAWVEVRPVQPDALKETDQVAIGRASQSSGSAAGLSLGGK
jgi:HlyD family secretion protein